MRKLIYKNGREEISGEHKRAQEVLVRKGIYKTLGNFGPHTAQKESIIHKVVEVFEAEGFQYTIIEHECMSLSMDFQTVSKPYIQRVAWFMPI
jgi:hypothetical protein